jgi:hypothetical protein
MHDHVLAVMSGKGADGRHRPAAGTAAIAGDAAIHVPRVEAEGAVVAVFTTVGDWADHRPAVAAPERLLSMTAAREFGLSGVIVIGMTVGPGQGAFLHRGRPRHALGHSDAIDRDDVLWGVVRTRTSFSFMKILFVR